MPIIPRSSVAVNSHKLAKVNDGRKTREASVLAGVSNRSQFEDGLLADVRVLQSRSYLRRHYLHIKVRQDHAIRR